MKLYLISQNENSGYDTYDSAVVAAPDEEMARNISPLRGEWEGKNLFMDWNEANIFSEWATRPENVNVKYIGEAIEGTKIGVILSSYNAG